MSPGGAARLAPGGVVPALELRDAELGFGPRTLWSGLDLVVEPGETVAVLGANGTGKSSLVKVLLGLLELRRGSARILGTPVGRGRQDIGYLPQQREYAAGVDLRARDLVRLGLDGHRWGLTLGARGRGARARTEDLLEAVGATAYADTRVGLLSGGELQRLRVAQALARDPALLLCDEPLQSLDPHQQRAVVDLVDSHRREHGAGVLFVTHEINPVLPVVDRVLYLAGGRFCLGTVDEVMTSATLSALYGGTVEVLRHGERLIVVGEGAAT